MELDSSIGLLTIKGIAKLKSMHRKKRVSNTFETRFNCVLMTSARYVNECCIVREACEEYR